MRIRTIKPDFWEHPVMSKQSDTTKLLAIGLLNVADDEGYFYAEPRMIRNAIRPLDDDSRITTVSLRELSKLGYISIKNHPTHGEIGFIPSFLNHQVINKSKPSKLKELYEYGIDTVLIRDEYRPERKGKEGKGKDHSCPQADVLEVIWNLSPSRAKSRSSKKQLADSWKLIPNIDKPSEDYLIQSLNRWIKSEDWTKDDGKYISGIHLWIKNRKWEVEPTPANQSTKKGSTPNGFGV